LATSFSSVAIWPAVLLVRRCASASASRSFSSGRRPAFSAASMLACASRAMAAKSPVCELT